MGEKSCQPEGLLPERPLTLSRGLLIFAISAAPRFALSTVLAATHTCFIMLGTLSDVSSDTPRSAPRPPIIEIRNLAKSYRRGAQIVPVLSDITLDILSG